MLEVKCGHWRQKGGMGNMPLSKMNSLWSASCSYQLAVSVQSETPDLLLL